MRALRAALAGLFVLLMIVPAAAREPGALAQQVLFNRYALLLELVRNTPTYSPPVASRAFAYVGITAHEALAATDPAQRTLAGQLNGLTSLPIADATQTYDTVAVLDAALGAAMTSFFANTGPTGQRAMLKMNEAMARQVDAGIDPVVMVRSRDLGLSIAAGIIDWSATDGGATVLNMGFAGSPTPVDDPADWVPTSTIQMQQAPLLPDWGQNRPFAMPDTAACPAPAFPAYSEDPTSAFYQNALIVRDTGMALTDEQRVIARFWSDDPMMSPTPPGHWISITLEIAKRDGLTAQRTASALAVLGVAVADGFIGCWHEKFVHNLLRPVTYIKRFIDPAWEPLLITPPFPEYPSGHSVQSGAAEVALTAIFGADFAFVDATHEDDGLPPRPFASFRAAAEEAAVSRLYGGIHYPFANTGGLEQGRCIGAWAARLKVTQ